MKFITLSTDVCSYGSKCTEDQRDALNATLTAAAQAAGIICLVDSTPEQREASPSPLEDENEIDWFAQSCAGGWDWSVGQWTEWLKQASTPLRETRAGLAARAIAAHQDASQGNDEPEECLVDLLTDLLHYADKHRLDFAGCERMARGYYSSERGA